MLAQYLENVRTKLGIRSPVFGLQHYLLDLNFKNPTKFWSVLDPEIEELIQYLTSPSCWLWAEWEYKPVSQSPTVIFRVYLKSAGFKIESGKTSKNGVTRTGYRIIGHGKEGYWASPNLHKHYWGNFNYRTLEEELPDTAKEKEQPELPVEEDEEPKPLPSGDPLEHEQNVSAAQEEGEKDGLPLEECEQLTLFSVLTEDEEPKPLSSADPLEDEQNVSAARGEDEGAESPLPDTAKEKEQPELPVEEDEEDRLSLAQYFENLSRRHSEKYCLQRYLLDLTLKSPTKFWSVLDPEIEELIQYLTSPSCWYWAEWEYKPVSQSPTVIFRSYLKSAGFEIESGKTSKNGVTRTGYRIIGHGYEGYWALPYLHKYYWGNPNYRTLEEELVDTAKEKEQPELPVEEDKEPKSLLSGDPLEDEQTVSAAQEEDEGTESPLPDVVAQDEEDEESELLLSADLRFLVSDTIFNLECSLVGRMSDVDIKRQLYKIREGIAFKPKDVIVDALERVLDDLRKAVKAEMISLDEINNLDTLIDILGQLGSLMTRIVTRQNFFAVITNLMFSLSNLQGDDSKSSVTAEKESSLPDTAKEKEQPEMPVEENEEDGLPLEKYRQLTIFSVLTEDEGTESPLPDVVTQDELTTAIAKLNFRAKLSDFHDALEEHTDLTTFIFRLNSVRLLKTVAHELQLLHYFLGKHLSEGDSLPFEIINIGSLIDAVKAFKLVVEELSERVDLDKYVGECQSLCESMELLLDSLCNLAQYWDGWESLVMLEKESRPPIPLVSKEFKLWNELTTITSNLEELAQIMPNHKIWYPNSFFKSNTTKLLGLKELRSGMIYLLMKIQHGLYPNSTTKPSELDNLLVKMENLRFTIDELDEILGFDKFLALLGMLDVIIQLLCEARLPIQVPENGVKERDPP